MLNEKQLELGEKVLVNSANVVLASTIFGNLFSPKGFSLSIFLLGCILFVGLIVFGFWVRRGDKK